MGLGKTRQAVVMLGFLKDTRKVEESIIVIVTQNFVLGLEKRIEKHLSMFGIDAVAEF